MADVLSPDQRHHNMAAIRSSSTQPEIRLRHALWTLGFRYRVNDKRLPGSPDIVLPKYRTVVFVHGCFWHGHKGCTNYSVPKTNTEFWKAKVARNRERDQKVWRYLEAKGWFVIIVWECELEKERCGDTISRVEQELLANRALYVRYQKERREARLQRQSESRERKIRRG